MQTPLMFAVNIDDMAVTARILDLKPSDLNEKDKSGNSILRYALNEERFPVTYLDSYTAPEVHADMIRFLIKKGANPVVHFVGEVAFPAVLMKAGGISLCKELMQEYPAMLDMGTDRRKRTTLLHVAASTSNQMTRYIYEQRPQFLNVMDEEFGWTPLMYAAQYGQLDNVKFLLEQGADANCKAFDRWYIVSLWAYLHRLDNKHSMLEDLYACTGEGKILLCDLLKKYGHAKFEQLDQESGITRETASTLAIKGAERHAQDADLRYYVEIQKLISQAQAKTAQILEHASAGPAI